MHRERMARMVVDHRRMAQDHQSATSNSDASRARARRQTIQRWLEGYAQNLEFDIGHHAVGEILACSFNADNHQFVSRCWACRALAPFESMFLETQDDRSWLGKDADGSKQVLDAAKIKSGKFWHSCYKDRVEVKHAEVWHSCIKDFAKLFSCAELLAVMANWELANPDEIHFDDVEW